MTRSLTLLARLSVLAALLAPHAAADTLEVCASGCPYTTIQAAVDSAVDGDTVLVHDGVYTESVDVDPRPQGAGIDMGADEYGPSVIADGFDDGEAVNWRLAG